MNDRNEQDAQDRLIVALDVPSAAAAMALVERLEGRIRWVKVGLELYLAAGPSVVETLARRGLRVFLDLKLHDIPNTVAGAVRSLASSGAELLTLHASGGQAMMEQAAAVGGGPRLVAVTVLTSMDAAALAGVGVATSPADQVLRLARLAHAAGIPGLVCSPEEVGLLRRELGTAPLLVVPGIRPKGAATGDQQRIATPAQAISEGASLLVVGRPITQALDPGAAVDRILAEMSA